MKRSEMLGIIKSVIKHNSFSELNEYSENKISAGRLAEILSERILNRIEETGMLPPLNEQVYHHMDNDDRISVNKVKPFYTWEHEDEK